MERRSAGPQKTGSETIGRRIAGRIHGECWETAAPTATPAVNITDSASMLFASAICEISNYFVYLHGYSENKTKPQ